MKTPWWMILIILAMLLPLIGYPYLAAAVAANEPVSMLMRFYPVYVVVADLCAWLCYPRRPEVSWILIVLLALSHAGVYWMAYQEGAPL